MILNKLKIIYSEVGIHAIQDLCGILNITPACIADYATFLPSSQKLELSDVFARTCMFSVTFDSSPPIYSASFGLENRVPSTSSDEKITNLVTHVLANQSCEEALVNLRDADAVRTLELIQEVSCICM